MSMPFYVSPEQLMKDRADFARKGIARGRSLVVVQYADGIVFVSENLSQALHKVSEIYDRIAFAAVGRYNEFENLRIAGVRLADMRGYAYDRRDVTGRGLANAYAQTLGTIFSSGGEKPYEVELFVAEVGDTAADDSIYRLTYDGQVADEHGYAVMGGPAEQATTYLKEHYTAGADARRRVVRLAVQALGQGEGSTPTRDDPVDEPRGRRPRPHPHPAAEVQAARGRPAHRDPRQRRRPTATEPGGDEPSGPGPSTDPSGPTTRPTPPTPPATSRRWRTPSPASPRRPTRLTLARLWPLPARRRGCGPCPQRHAGVRRRHRPLSRGPARRPVHRRRSRTSENASGSPSLGGMRADRDVVVGEVTTCGLAQGRLRALPACRSRGRAPGGPARVAADPPADRVPHPPDSGGGARDVAAAAARQPARLREHGQAGDASQTARAARHAAHPADSPPLGGTGSSWPPPTR